MIASTRMYNVAPGATLAWRRLMNGVAARSGVAMDIVDHPHPATLRDLWNLPDLGCAFMCGWPLAREGAGRPVIAAPVPAGADGALYHAVFVVAAQSPFTRVEETFGGRFAFNARESHSGWNMPRAHLASLGGSYVAEVGPFGPHQRAAAAVAEGEADVAALDSLVWALLERHDAGLAARLRVVGRTPPQPAPPLVGARPSTCPLPQGEGSRDAPVRGPLPQGQGRGGGLGRALLALHRDAEGRALLADVCLSRFAAATAADYAATRALEPA